jgi:hypothetical protein
MFSGGGGRATDNRRSARGAPNSRPPHLLADGGAERQQRHLAATAVLQAFHHADGLGQRDREVERVVVRRQRDPLARLQGERWSEEVVRKRVGATYGRVEWAWTGRTHQP